MPTPGDIVTVDFVGATGIKRRPAIVVSSALYHTSRPDVVLAALTTQIPSVIGLTDYVLQDWEAAGLRKSSAFRSYFSMAVANVPVVIGHLSERDWQAVQNCLAHALAVPAKEQP